MVVATTRRRKSEKLSPEEKRAFTHYVKKFDTKLDAIEAIGISRPTLDAILVKGSGHPDSILKIRNALSK